MFFHFSEEPKIRRFDPRPSRLNRPLVWAISDAFDFLYLFPRDCPRIVIWATEQTTTQDAQHWLSGHRRVAFVQEHWMDRISKATIYRYSLPGDHFTALDDVGMAVSDRPVVPDKIEALTGLPALLAAREVSLRSAPSLDPIKAVWDSTLHASGIRLRNAA
ncbi:DUF6886 family protein [Yoonia sp. R2-816]|uniref:DUF6886 family protein n=1 Tax=Yoonia sp. R2-816 TaxID=3342638 RepID=UPI0037290F60